jgi:hypothetical protein
MQVGYPVAVDNEHVIWRARKQVVLFPLRIDDSVMETSEAWVRLLRGQRNIGDFTRWKEHDSYQKSFERLMRDLRVKQHTERLWAEYEAFASRDLSEFELVYLFIDWIAERLHLGQPRELLQECRIRSNLNSFRFRALYCQQST